MVSTRTAVVGNALLIVLAAGAATVLKLVLAEPGGPGLVWRVVTELALSAARC